MLLNGLMYAVAPHRTEGPVLSMLLTVTDMYVS